MPRQTQPGFTHWGSFAELVVVDREGNAVSNTYTLNDAWREAPRPSARI